MTEDSIEPVENTSNSTENEAREISDEFPPGTIVLAKMKSFPPWPGIVVPTEMVPTNIMERKPKLNSHNSSTNKKSNTPEDSRLWCVRFLRDDNFMWATIKDIKLLTRDSIEQFLSAKKQPKKTIRLAYEMALNPPDLEEFIIYGSDGKPIAIDNEADDEDFQDEVIGNGEDDDDEASLGAEDDDDDDFDVDTKHTPKKRKQKAQPTKRVGRKKATPASTSKPRGRKAKVAVHEQQEPDTSSDEDWAADHDNDEEPVAIDIPSSKDITDQLKKKTQQVKKIRLELQSFFLDSKDLNLTQSSKSSLNTSLDSLKNLNFIESSLIKTTGLHKVLFDILKRPDLTTKDLKAFRKKLSDLVLDLYGLVVETDEHWDFVEREVEAEVNQADGDVNQAEPEPNQPETEVNQPEPQKGEREEEVKSEPVKD